MLTLMISLIKLLIGCVSARSGAHRSNIMSGTDLSLTRRMKLFTELKELSYVINKSGM